MIRQFLLASALIAVPVGLFTAYELTLGQGQAASAATAPAPGLGDMSSFKAIVTDVQGQVAAGSFDKAKERITDLESAWDDAEATLRPQAPEAWGTVDDAIDAALRAVRSKTPDAATMTATLAALSGVLDAPVATGGGSVQMVQGIAVTDAAGHALPCEEMLKTLRDRLGQSGLDPAAKDKATALQAQATERCNADDDKRADDFSAQALALLPAS